jgi:hypothetical protein
MECLVAEECKRERGDKKGTLKKHFYSKKNLLLFAEKRLENLRLYLCECTFIRGPWNLSGKLYEVILLESLHKIRRTKESLRILCVRRTL